MENIVYGAEIVMRHVESPGYLFSDDLHYSHPDCSDQQLVAATTYESSKSRWLVKGADGVDPAAIKGMAVRAGNVVRLEWDVGLYELLAKRIELNL